MTKLKRKYSSKAVFRSTAQSSKKATRVVSKASVRAVKGSETSTVLSVRQAFGISRKVFSRLCQFSERAIAEWESGEAPGGVSRQRMTELGRLQRALAMVIQPDFIGEWLQTPNDALDGLKPLEVIERGHIDRIWRLIYSLESGVPG